MCLKVVTVEARACLFTFPWIDLLINIYSLTVSLIELSMSAKYQMEGVTINAQIFLEVEFANVMKGLS